MRIPRGTTAVAQQLKPSTLRARAAMRPPRTLSEENLSRYVPGGYHPVRVGDTLDNGKYRVLRKLGYGVYSTVWLAHDTETKEQVALKILTADSYDGHNDTYELAMLARISERAEQDTLGQHVLGLRHAFRHRGPNGQHACLVLKAMGPDVRQLRDLFPRRRLPVPMAKKATKDLLSALRFLHDTCGIIHTDIKPTNILLETPALDDMFRRAPPELLEQRSPALPPPDDFYIASEPVIASQNDLTPQNMSFRLADFGTASWIDDHLTEWIQPDMLRAPEVLLGAAWDTKVDIWNAGLVIWELTTGQLCFDGQATATADYSSEAHVAQMEAILGPMPASLLSRSARRAVFFGPDGHGTRDMSFPRFTLAALCDSSGAFTDGRDMRYFLDLIHSTLSLEPTKRPTAKDLLAAQWLTSTEDG